MDIELSPDDSELSVSVSVDRLYEEIGNQGILGDDIQEPNYFYLAALSLELWDDPDYSVEDVIVEVVQCSDVSFSEEQLDKLRQASEATERWM